MKDAPIGVYRELRQLKLGELRRTARTASDWIAMTLAMGAIVGVAVLLIQYGPFERTHRHGRVYISNLSIMIVGCTGLAICSVIWFAFTRWRDRGTVPFPFAVTLVMPRWWVFRRDGDEAMFLTDGTDLVCLFNRPTPEPVGQAIDVVDPDKALETADPEGDVLAFDLPDERRASGALIHIPMSTSYAMVFADTEMRVADISGAIWRYRSRDAGRRPQKWRALSGENLVRRRR